MILMTRIMMKKIIISSTEDSMTKFVVHIMNNRYYSFYYDALMLHTKVLIAFSKKSMHTLLQVIFIIFCLITILRGVKMASWNLVQEE